MERQNLISLIFKKVPGTLFSKKKGVPGTLLTILLLFANNQCFANSCCGQSPASFTVLNLRQAFSLNLGTSLADGQGRVFQNINDYQNWSDRRREVTTISLDMAAEVALRHQVFINTRLMQGRFKDAWGQGDSQDLSDTLLGYNYELVSEYSYSSWRPLVYLSAFVNLPTGKSAFEPGRLGEGTDVTGHNQWGTGLGITLRKTWFPLTMTFQAKSLYLFPKTFEQGYISSFYDTTLALLSVYNLGIWDTSVNAGVTYNHLSPLTNQTWNFRTQEAQVSTVVLGFQRAINDQVSFNLTYSDQTWIRNAKNIVLNRTYALNFNYNWF